VAEYLFIRMSDHPDQATIVALNADGHLVDGPETVSLMTAAERAQERQVTVLLPARELVCCVTSVPAASPARMRQMLPFSLEDEFAGDIDALHFAAGEKNDADQLAVSVIARERFGFWLDALRTAGVSARRICSEADAVPDTPGSVTLFLEGQSILGRRPGNAPFVFDELSLSELWQLLEAERQGKDDLDNAVLFVDRATQDERSEEIDAWRQNVANVNVKELADGCLPKLASGLVFRAGTNLLQGDYAPRSSFRTLARPWRTAAAFALGFLAFSVLAKGIELVKLSRDENLLTEQATEICADSYASQQLERCLVEMGRRLTEHGQTVAGGGDTFLSMLAAIAETIGDEIAINRVSYLDHIMTLELITPNISSIDAFDLRLTESNGLTLEVQTSTTERDGNMRARLRIVALNP